MLLAANRRSYETANAATLLPADIEHLETAKFRDAAGVDRDLQIISAEAYQAIAEKGEGGEPQRVHLEKGLTPADHRLFVWPVLATITTASVVLGTDGMTYTCVSPHTAASRNKPVTGSDYDQFWKLAGSAGAAWVAGTEYVGQESILLTYKRPLSTFSIATENLDMPKGWERYLTYRLAFELCPDHQITTEESNRLEKVSMEAREKLFPSSRVRTTDVHNKALFF